MSDTQFAGFAQLLFEELYNISDVYFDPLDDRWKDQWKELIARRAYDFACHVATHTILTAHGNMKKVPDLTAWPEE